MTTKQDLLAQLAAVRTQHDSAAEDLAFALSNIRAIGPGFDDIRTAIEALPDVDDDDQRYYPAVLRAVSRNFDSPVGRFRVSGGHDPCSDSSEYRGWSAWVQRIRRPVSPALFVDEYNPPRPTGVS